jgi:hypothetical protein
LRSYRLNIKDANELALGDSPIVAPLREFMGKQTDQRWKGSSTSLLKELTELADAKITSSKDWPKRPNILSGKLRRLAPNLRKTGLLVEFAHTKLERQVILSVLTKRKEKDRHHRQHRHRHGKTRENGDDG